MFNPAPTPAPGGEACDSEPPARATVILGLFTTNEIARVDRFVRALESGEVTTPERVQSRCWLRHHSRDLILALLELDPRLERIDGAGRPRLRRKP